MTSTASIVSARKRSQMIALRLRPIPSIARGVGWTMVALAAIYYLHKEALPYLQPLSEERARSRTTEIFPFLLTHILAGAVALLVGPLQFWSTLRNRYLAVHRLIGRTYLFAILVGSVASMYITVVHPHPVGPVFRSGLAALAIVWFTTSLMAYLSIRQGNVQEHREWMIRSYTVTFGFVFFRIGAAQLRGVGMELPEVAGISAWMCWAVPLFVVEVALSIARQSQRARTSRNHGVKHELGQRLSTGVPL